MSDFWFANYVSETAITDQQNRYTGEYTLTYSTPTKCRGNISAERGSVMVEHFGNLVEYRRTIVLEAIPEGFTEASILWVGIDPVAADGKTAVPHNYKVVSIQTTINGFTVVIKKVDVSGQA